MNSTLPVNVQPLLDEIGSPGNEADPDVSVYHYTSAAGAISILEHQKLWISNARFLNDSSELRLAYGLAHKVALDKISERNEKARPFGSTLSDEDMAEGELLFRILRSMESVHHNTNLDAYIACFSLEEDLLSQWRGYADGGGLCVGVNPETLLQSAYSIAPSIGSMKRHVAFRHIEYDSTKWLAKVVEVIDLLVKHMRRRVVEQKGIDVARIAEAYCSGFTKAISRAAPFIKDAGFVEEREVRLSIYTNSGAGSYKFRAAASGIIPYIEIPLGGSIRSVRVGPRQDYELQLRALQLMKLDRSIELLHSIIPYRT